MSDHRFGATTNDWAHLDAILGLGDDLLPVVSSPHLPISEKSTMKTRGKTPSRYNGRGEVVGFGGWTNYKATRKDIALWSDEPDYGICIQTRYVRAIDMDINDEKIAREVEAIIEDVLGFKLPKRWRKNGHKCLFAFILPGQYRKMILRAANDERIEFLADGQQFIAAGEHFDRHGNMSGARYEWTPALENLDIPEITEEQFRKIWKRFEERYAVASTVELGGARRTGANLNVPDKTLDFLWKHGKVIGGDDDKVFIACPWESEHTSGENASATAYFPAGTKGYAQGHFRCMHAHCAERTDGDFIQVLGVYEAEVEDLGALPVPTKDEMLRLKENDKGEIYATLSNLDAVLRTPERFGWQVRRDTFYQRSMISRYAEDNWRYIEDTDIIKLRLHLERNHRFRPISPEKMAHAVMLAAVENRYDTAQNWIETLKWDGINRIESFFPRYFGAGDNDYSQAVSRYIWTALAGRIAKPGIKADMMPVLVGQQGVGKSTGVMSMSPEESFFAEIDIMEKGSDLCRLMRGKLIGEVSELRNFRKVDKEHIKSFLSRTTEEWVEKYDKFSSAMPRRIMFIGTTNQKDFLNDETGNRRFLPLEVSKVDVVAIKQDCIQLWAQARDIFLQSGIDWSAERLASEVHETHRAVHHWEVPIGRWLNTADEQSGIRPRDRKVIHIEEVLRHALHITVDRLDGRQHPQVCKVLRGFGYDTGTARVNGKPVSGWVVKDSEKHKVKLEAFPPDEGGEI